MMVTGWLIAVLIALPAVPTSISVGVDVEAARSILTLPSRPSSSDEPDRIASLPGVEALIQQAGRVSRDATRGAFLAGLRAFAAGQDPQPDPFNFARVRERLPQTLALLQRIEADGRALERDIVAHMSYSPAGEFATKLTLVASGTSDGFSPGRGQLYVATDYFRDDWDGLVSAIAWRRSSRNTTGGRRFSGYGSDRRSISFSDMQRWRASIRTTRRSSPSASRRDAFSTKSLELMTQ